MTLNHTVQYTTILYFFVFSTYIEKYPVCEHPYLHYDNTYKLHISKKIYIDRKLQNMYYA
jgi:hypothetical protein